MSVSVAKSAGFCFGVSRAVELVQLHRPADAEAEPGVPAHLQGGQSVHPPQRESAP